MKYWYRVRATNASGDGAYSAESSVTTLPGAPGTPTFSGATTTSLTVSWTAPAGGATSYELERAPSATGTFVRVATPTSATAIDAGLTVGTTYWYRVRAVTSAGPSGYSAVASRPTLPDVPGAITFSNIAATSLRVTWGSRRRSDELQDRAGAGQWLQRARHLAAARVRSHGHDLRQHGPQREREVLVPRTGDERVR